MNSGVLPFFTQPLGQSILAAAMTGVAAALLGRKRENKGARILVEHDKATTRNPSGR